MIARKSSGIAQKGAKSQNILSPNPKKRGGQEGEDEERVGMRSKRFASNENSVVAELQSVSLEPPAPSSSRSSSPPRSPPPPRSSSSSPPPPSSSSSPRSSSSSSSRSSSSSPSRSSSPSPVIPPPPQDDYNALLLKAAEEEEEFMSVSSAGTNEEQDLSNFPLQVGSDEGLEQENSPRANLLSDILAEASESTNVLCDKEAERENQKYTNPVQSLRLLAIETGARDHYFSDPRTEGVIEDALDGVGRNAQTGNAAENNAGHRDKLPSTTPQPIAVERGRERQLANMSDPGAGMGQ